MIVSFVIAACYSPKSAKFEEKLRKDHKARYSHFMMANAYVLLTRPEPESLKLKQELNNAGINSIASPVLYIDALPQSSSPDVGAYDALLVTSKYTAAFLPEHIKDMDIPIYSIGAETSAALEARGYRPEATAERSSMSLYELIKDKPQKYLHLGGEDTSPDLQKHILNSALDVEHVPLYKAKASTKLEEEALNELKSNNIYAVLLFSARSAETFECLCEQAGLSNRLKTITALCLASSVIKSLDRKKWKDVIAAPQPSAASMIEKLTDMMKSQGVRKI